MANNGWIKLYRKIQECILWEEEEPFDRRSAWIDLLLLASHADKTMLFDGEPMIIKAGQRVTSIRNLAERWHWGKEKVTKFLNVLERDNMITRDSDNRRTLITIINYGIYQGEADSDEDTKRTPTRTVTRTVTRPNQEYKEYKEDINIIHSDGPPDKSKTKHKYGEYKHVLLTGDERERLDKDFGTEQALSMIKILDEYIETSGRKYKNCNLVLRGWVLERVSEKKSTKKNSFNDISKADYGNMTDLEKQLLSKPI